MTYTVYKHISPDWKIYIGITSKKPEYRWGTNGWGYIGNTHFYRAIQKYGWENFHHVIIAQDLTFKQACEMEIYLIALYDSTNPDKGYNVSTGGEYRFAGYHHSEETKRKIGDAQRGELNHRYGKSPWNIGKQFSKATCEKMSIARTERYGRGVVKYSLKHEFLEVYPSIELAGRSVGVTRQSIYAVCIGKRPTCKGFIWRFVDDSQN